MQVHDGPDTGSKREVLTWMLERSMVLVILDARLPGVMVPEDLRKPDLQLNVSPRFGTPFELTLRGVEATLLFGQNTFPCVLPWDSIWGLASVAEQVSYLWKDDIPEGIEQIVVSRPTPTSYPALRLVK